MLVLHIHYCWLTKQDINDEAKRVKYITQRNWRFHPHMQMFSLHTPDTTVTTETDVSNIFAYFAPMKAVQ
jgi:hypothetical protein